MITFVVWKWSDPANGRVFLSEHVNVLQASLARFARFRHRLACVTDDPAGLDPRIVVVEPPHLLYADLPAPGPVRGVKMPRSRPKPAAVQQTRPKPGTGVRHRGVPRGFSVRGASLDDLEPRAPLQPPPQLKRFPQCWRRLWNFSGTWAREQFGDRIVSLDIDVIVTGELAPLINRSADFVGWCDERFGWMKIAGGVYMLRTGSRPEVFDDFDPDVSPGIARAAGFSGSDQSWISYKLYPPGTFWSRRDGVVKINWLPRHHADVPLGTRLVFTGGNCPPWDPQLQRLYPWIKRYWRA